MPSDTDVVLLSLEKLLKDGVIKMEELNMEQLSAVLNLLRALNRMASAQLQQIGREE